jgi:microcin C transport system substrate-binding protein
VNAIKQRHVLKLALIGLLLCPGLAAAEGTKTSHGISVFGDLKYPAGFKHFEYVNPNAPKGGVLRLWGLDNFETLNPFILKGSKEQYNGLLYDSLMVRATDEPDALYGLVAESAVIPDKGGWVAFNLDPRATFSDGSPVTTADVVFTYNALIKDGHPRYRILFRDVAGATATGPRQVKFTFKPGRHRDLPTLLATLPVLSKAYYGKVDFTKTTFTPPLGSGPYKVAKIEPGRSIVYGRNPDYWARDLPVNKGRYNFDRLRIDYYRDRDVAFQAIFAGAYDFREEYTSKSWATQYDKPPVRQKLIVRETLPDETPSGVQAFFFNMRREKFKDRRVRRALDLAFDYEWTNKNLFFSQYERTNSMFENSSLAAHAPPDAAELALLEPLRGKIPDEVFERPYKSPVSNGPGGIRRNLRKAVKLLRAAGYKVDKGVLLDKAGRPFTVEFLLFEASFQRIIGPYIRNLKRLGIQASIRIVDVANFKVRADQFDYDVIIRRFVQPLTPGIEQRNYFGSANADMVGTLNVAGIKDAAVDILIEKVTSAATRPALVAATRALDRVLMWNNYSLPQWYKGAHNIAYWNKFGRPKIKPKFGRGVVDSWWFDSRKAAMIAAGKAPTR